jgi:creatinine amidohydrolase
VDAERAILPLGSYEDHGALPPDTDTRIALCLASRVAALTGWEVLPAIPYGFSPEHSPRSIWIGASSYMELLKSLLLTAGRKSVLLINGHGGNRPLARAASFELMGAVSLDLLDVWGAVSSILGIGGAIIHAGPVEASLASACGVEISGYAEVPRDSVLERVRAAAEVPPSPEAPWRSAELPEPVREYSRELGEWISDELVAAALRGALRGPRL